MPKWDKWLDEDLEERDDLQKVERIKKRRPMPKEDSGKDPAQANK